MLLLLPDAHVAVDRRRGEHLPKLGMGPRYSQDRRVVGLVGMSKSSQTSTEVGRAQRTTGLGQSWRQYLELVVLAPLALAVRSVLSQAPTVTPTQYTG